MRIHLLGIVCLVVTLVGCTNQSNGAQTEDIEELKKQIEQISMEKNESLLKTSRGTKRNARIGCNGIIESNTDYFER